MNRLQMFLIVIIIMCTLRVQSQIDNSDVLDGHVSKEWLSISDDNYKIDYPSDWDVDKAGQMGTSFILLSAQSDVLDNFRENVNLVVQDLTGYDINLDQYVELSKGQVETMITDGNILLSERVEKEGAEFHKVIYTGKQGVFNLKFEQYYLVTGDKAYVLTLTCKEDEFDNYKEIGERILNSFELK